jgi:hypothetical protein
MLAPLDGACTAGWLLTIMNHPYGVSGQRPGLTWGG